MSRFWTVRNERRFVPRAARCGERPLRSTNDMTHTSKIVRNERRFVPRAARCGERALQLAPREKT